MDAIFSNPWYWMIAAGVFFIIELMAPGVFFVWVGLGALVTGLVLAALPDLSLTTQIIVFVIAMTASVLLGIKIQARSAKKRPTHINAGLDQYVGRSVTAEQDFVGGKGRIRMEDTTYSALCDAPITAGSHVKIVEVRNGAFVVSPDPAQ